MADKRMLAKKITDHDNFVALPAAAQALYLHLTMSADDDGFCSQVSTAMYRAHAKKKDLDALVKARYLIRFDNGVTVIKHWRMANAIRKDRYTPTVYQEEYRKLTTKKNLAYTLVTTRQPGDDLETEDLDADGCQDDNQTATRRQPSVANPQPQVRLGKVRLGKDSNNLVVVGAHESEETPEAGNDLGRVMSYYMDKINPTPSPICLDLLKGYTESLGADVILHAFGIALDERKTGWSYIQGILQHYERDGLKTMDAVLRAEQEHQAGKEEAKDRGRREKPSRITGKAKIDWKPDELGKLVSDLDRI